jgi:hypothetical protein
MKFNSIKQLEQCIDLFNPKDFYMADFGHVGYSLGLGDESISDELSALHDTKVFKEVYFPLFLQRVRHGINKAYWIDDNYVEWSIADSGKDEIGIYMEDVYESTEDFPDTDEGLEEAIVKILSKVLEFKKDNEECTYTIKTLKNY